MQERLRKVVWASIMVDSYDRYLQEAKLAVGRTEEAIEKASPDDPGQLQFLNDRVATERRRVRFYEENVKANENQLIAAIEEAAHGAVR